MDKRAQNQFNMPSHGTGRARFIINVLDVGRLGKDQKYRRAEEQGLA
jgi:hypothetical protein